MTSGKPGTQTTHMHPLEESVLSLAAGRLEHARQEENAYVVAGTDEAVREPKVSDSSTVSNRLVSISETIRACMDFVGKQVLGRREVIAQSFLALLTGEHQLLISRTGMAKSLLARQIFACFEGATVFEKQLTKDTMPENLFGAYDIEAMKKGKMIHNVEGSVVLSHFAFLDEIFDANDMLLRSLLSLLNEKQLINGEQVVSSLLHSTIAAANYIRVTQILEAVIDRFLYKSYIPENRDLYFQYGVDQIYQERFGKVAQPKKLLTLGELAFIKKHVQSRQVLIPPYLLFLKNHILKTYIQETRNSQPDREDYTISDRKSVKSQDTLRALAVLDGRVQVEEQDLDSLYYVVCTLGREDEKNRLLKITATAKKYFRQDRNVLENTFNAVSILQRIKSVKSNELLKTDTLFNDIKSALEQAVKSESSLVKGLISRVKQSLAGFSRDTYLPETFSLLERIAEQSLQEAQTREAREIISGFRQDLFDEKKIALV